MVYKINFVKLNQKEKVISNQDKEEKRLLLEQELEMIIREMEALGYRARTLFDYRYHLTKFITANNIRYVDELLKYLNHGDIIKVINSKYLNML